MAAEENNDKQKTLSRRSVTAGIAWSVPAVAAVSAAPLAAASPVCISVEGVGDAWKYPEQRGRHVPCLRLQGHDHEPNRRDRSGHSGLWHGQVRLRKDRRHPRTLRGQSVHGWT